MLSILLAFLALQPGASLGHARPGKGHLEAEPSNRTSFRGCQGHAAPKLKGRDLLELIQRRDKTVVVAVPGAASTESILGALHAEGIPYAMEEFDANGTYETGMSEVWDWLHCNFPDDRELGRTMPSYVFHSGAFLGQGFAVSRKVAAGELSLAAAGGVQAPPPPGNQSLAAVNSSDQLAGPRRSEGPEKGVWSDPQHCLLHDTFAHDKQRLLDLVDHLYLNKNRAYVQVYGVSGLVDATVEVLRKRDICFTLHTLDEWSLDLGFLQCREGDSGQKVFVYACTHSHKGFCAYKFYGDISTEERLDSMEDEHFVSAKYCR